MKISTWSGIQLAIKRLEGRSGSSKITRLADVNKETSQYLYFELKYSMATKQYLQKGCDCDGYTLFQNVREICSLIFFYF